MAEQIPALSVEHIRKSFKIPLEGSNGLKQKLINTLKGRKGYREFTPLKDISFTVNKGDFFGIVGRNGSGKSTLLKTIAGIYAPDSGAATVHGTLVPFIELGVGFNPELTGRENVYLNAALLGFSRSEIAEMYDEIVAFAELDTFMDERLKNYSSGMQVRLAFSIAIRAQSDILLLDEVLAVGDEAFQEKCLGIFEQYKAQGRTVILVTHNMSVVERFCNRALFLKEGEIVKIGDPAAIAEIYSHDNKENYSLDKMREDEKRQIASDFEISLLDPQTMQPNNRFLQGQEVIVKLAWPQREGVQHAGIALYKHTGEYMFGPNTYQDAFQMGDTKELLYHLTLQVAAGEYAVNAALFGATDQEKIAIIPEGPTLIVDPGDGLPKAGGLAYLPHSWESKKGTA